MNDKNAIVLYPRVTKFASRIFKEAKFLNEELGLRVSIYSLYFDSTLHEREKIYEGIEIIRIKGRYFEKPQTLFWNIFRYFEFYYKLFSNTRKIKNVEFLIPHNLTILPFSIFLNFILKAKLIYHPHELETEREGLKGLSKKVSQILERLFIKYVDHTIVVGDLIKQWYCDKYKIKNISVVKNIPAFSYNHEKTNYFRNRFKIPEDKLIFLYQGMLSDGRNIPLLLDKFKLSKHAVIFMGFGKYEDLIAKEAKQCNNIHLHEAVPPSNIKFFTSSADIGLCYLENFCLSFYYSLPNKLFEYFNSGLPVLISDFPEMKKIVTEYKVGWTCNQDSELLDTIESISKIEVENKKEGLLKVFKSISWQNELNEMRKVFI